MSTSMTELSPPVALFSGYAFVGRIGAGAYGTVFLARPPSGPPCAVKFVLAARAHRIGNAIRISTDDFEAYLRRTSTEEELI